MNLVTFLATYILLWWLLFFMVLPWGVHAQKLVKPGLEPGAPERPRLGIKAGITSALAALICLALHLTAAQWGPWLQTWLRYD